MVIPNKAEFGSAKNPWRFFLISEGYSTNFGWRARENATFTIVVYKVSSDVAGIVFPNLHTAQLPMCDHFLVEAAPQEKG